MRLFSLSSVVTLHEVLTALVFGTPRTPEAEHKLRLERRAKLQGAVLRCMTELSNVGGWNLDAIHCLWPEHILEQLPAARPGEPFAVSELRQIANAIISERSEIEVAYPCAANNVFHLARLGCVRLIGKKSRDQSSSRCPISSEYFFGPVAIDHNCRDLAYTLRGTESSGAYLLPSRTEVEIYYDIVMTAQDANACIQHCKRSETLASPPALTGLYEENCAELRSWFLEDYIPAFKLVGRLPPRAQIEHSARERFPNMRDRRVIVRAVMKTETPSEVRARHGRPKNRAKE